MTAIQIMYEDTETPTAAPSSVALLLRHAALYTTTSSSDTGVQEVSDAVHTGPDMTANPDVEAIVPP
eukprot:3002-Heterococcus_DN1.PRE.3